MVSLSHYLQGSTAIPSGWPWDFWLPSTVSAQKRSACAAVPRGSFGASRRFTVGAGGTALGCAGFLWAFHAVDHSKGGFFTAKKYVESRQRIQWFIDSSKWPFMTFFSWVSYPTLANTLGDRRKGSGPACSWPFERTAYQKTSMAPRVVRILILTHVYVFSPSANVTIPHSSVMFSTFFRGKLAWSTQLAPNVPPLKNKGLYTFRPY